MDTKTSENSDIFIDAFAAAVEFQIAKTRCLAYYKKIVGTGKDKKIALKYLPLELHEVVQEGAQTSRIDVIGQNGNDGLHYDAEGRN